MATRRTARALFKLGHFFGKNLLEQRVRADAVLAHGLGRSVFKFIGIVFNRLGRALDTRGRSGAFGA